MLYLFDMDGTLIDSNGIWKDVDSAFLARRGLPYTKEYYEGVAHTIFPLAAKFTKEFCHLPESEEAIERFIRSKCKGKPLDRETQRKLAAALQRRGFSWQEIRPVLNRLGEEMAEE